MLRFARPSFGVPCVGSIAQTLLVCDVLRPHVAPRAWRAAAPAAGDPRRARRGRRDHRVPPRRGAPALDQLRITLCRPLRRRARSARRPSRPSTLTPAGRRYKAGRSSTSQRASPSTRTCQSRWWRYWARRWTSRAASWASTCGENDASAERQQTSPGRAGPGGGDAPRLSCDFARRPLGGGGLRGRGPGRSAGHARNPGKHLGAGPE